MNKLYLDVYHKRERLLKYEVWLRRFSWLSLINVGFVVLLIVFSLLDSIDNFFAPTFFSSDSLDSLFEWLDALFTAGFYFLLLRGLAALIRYLLSYWDEQHQTADASGLGAGQGSK